MQASPIAVRLSRGFTLIELLVVISIIGVLIAILLPVTNSMMNSARKTQALAAEANINAAIKAYQNDYSRYPINAKQQDAAAPEGSTGPSGGSGLNYDTVYGDLGGTYPNAYLFDILRAIGTNTYDTFNKDNALNSRQVVYFQAADAKNPTLPRAGFATADFKAGKTTVHSGEYMDPWGNPYMVFIDANEDHDLSLAVHWFYYDVKWNADTTDPNTKQVQHHAGDVPLSSATCSLGRDGTLGSNGDSKLQGSDDIASWQ